MLKASAIDAGDPDGPWSSTLHPRNKQELGSRLSLVARALTYNEPNLTHEGPRMASVSVVSQGNDDGDAATTTTSIASAGSSGTRTVVVATVRFVPSTIGDRLVLGPPVESTQQTCLAGEIPTLCGYFTVVYFSSIGTNSSGSGGGMLQTGQAKAVASLSTNQVRRKIPSRCARFFLRNVIACPDGLGTHMRKLSDPKRAVPFRLFDTARVDPFCLDPFECHGTRKKRFSFSFSVCPEPVLTHIILVSASSQELLRIIEHAAAVLLCPLPDLT